MTKKATDEDFNALHRGLAEVLSKRIKDGTATAADLSVARQFLKDNGIQAVPVPGSPVRNLADDLPTFDDDPMTH